MLKVTIKCVTLAIQYSTCDRFVPTNLLFRIQVADGRKQRPMKLQGRLTCLDFVRPRTPVTLNELAFLSARIEEGDNNKHTHVH
jgi:hypothetical protein